MKIFYNVAIGFEYFPLSLYPHTTKVDKMIEKAKLSVDDLRQIPLGASMSWRLENGAAILTARNIISYLYRHDAIRFKTQADFINNVLEVTRTQ